MDCASAPALYESSAEYYSNEQKKTHKVTQSLSKNQDLQQIDGSLRAESRRSSVNVPSTTERLLRHRQRLQSQTDTPYTVQATARSYQALFPDANFNPTQRSQLTTAFEKRRKNLVQLISNNFAFPSRSTKPTFFEASTLKTTPFDYLKEMQVAAESASFAANKNNRQFLQDYNTKNYRPYPVYTPNTPKPKLKSNPNLTTLYDIRDKDPHASNIQETTKRPTLIPYTKTYTTSNDPYTRPGVSLLRNFLAKEKNKTVTTTTEISSPVTEIVERITENTNAFESVTKIPTTRSDGSYFSEAASSDRYDVYSTTKHVEGTTEPSYKERRERLMRKLNLDTFAATEPTPAISVIPTEKFYGDQSRSGLVVPASSSKTLHSLAIYYATALDNLSTTPTPDEAEITTPVLDYEAMEEALPALFSSNTINKYSSLFSDGANNAELLEEIREDPNGTYNELMEDLMVQQSQSPLAASPQIRELAQVFTHALSAYLQDPVQFRKVLSDIRPTHPTFGELGTTTDEPANTEPTTTINEDDDEILGFSEDNKASLVNAREPKALDISSKYQTISYDDVKVTTHRPTEPSTTFNYRGTSARNPFRCCGKISASYTSASSPLSPSTTPIPYTNTVAFNVNTLANNYSDISTTENYSGARYGGFQNNALVNDPYGTGVGATQNKPLSEYVEATNLPTVWGIDVSASTAVPVSTQDFESKKIRTTTVIPTTTAVYFTETDSVELENEEELQRAHSQSFVGPQNNNQRQGKQLNIEESFPVKRPSEDLEAPTLPDEDATTIQTTPEPTTYKLEESTTTTQVPSSVFTSPDFDKSTSQFQWSSTFDNWQSTVIDPITLNDGLSHTAEDITTDTRDTSFTYNYNTATTPTIDYATTEQAVSSTSNIEVTTYGTKADNRRGRFLKDVSTEPAQDLSTITDTVVEKAKEIMGGMNATTTEKLMNVMKKTKSKTVKRLILLLVQTCDDDHNSTAEASKKALLEALMAVSQKDMEEIAKEEEASTPEYESVRRTDRLEVRPRQDRRGKSINFDPSAINSLSNPTTERVQTNPTTEIVKTTEEPETTVSSTTQTLLKTTATRRGVKKFGTRTTPLEARSTKAAFIDTPKAEARTADKEDLKTASDTRALELLRSLYTIAARWG